MQICRLWNLANARNGAKVVVCIRFAWHLCWCAVFSRIFSLLLSFSSPLARQVVCILMILIFQNWRNFWMVQRKWKRRKHNICVVHFVACGSEKFFFSVYAIEMKLLSDFSLHVCAIFMQTCCEQGFVVPILSAFTTIYQRPTNDCFFFQHTNFSFRRKERRKSCIHELSAGIRHLFHTGCNCKECRYLLKWSISFYTPWILLRWWL